MGTLAEEIGANIRIAREAAGLSQAALAQEIYVSRQTVNNWECGRTLPDVESLKMLSRRLETSVDALMGDDAQELLTSTADDRHTLAKLLAGSVFWYGAFFVVTLAVIVIQVWRIGLDASVDRSLYDGLALWGVCLNGLQLGLCFARASQQRKIRRFLDDQRLHDAVEVAAYLAGGSAQLGGMSPHRVGGARAHGGAVRLRVCVLWQVRSRLDPGGAARICSCLRWRLRRWRCLRTPDGLRTCATLRCCRTAGLRIQACREARRNGRQ